MSENIEKDSVEDGNEGAASNTNDYVDFIDTKIGIIVHPDLQFTMIMSEDMKEILQGIGGATLIEIPWNSNDIKLYSIEDATFSQLMDGMNAAKG